jgi:sugar O-acyltransferase (sialic acid O-acetyltransferase NeuD family)
LILGATDFSTEIADVAQSSGFEVVGFVENLEPRRPERVLDDLPVYWIDDIAHLVEEHQVVCGLGTTKRTRFIADAERLGFTFATVIHPSAVVSRRSTIGPGSVVSAGVIIAAHTTVGSNVLLNRGALVGHHTVLGDVCTIGPGANIAGFCELGARAYVGMGAKLLNTVHVGTCSIVAAGAVVTENVDDRVMVAGVPARVVRRDVEGM